MMMSRAQSQHTDKIYELISEYNYKEGLKLCNKKGHHLAPLVLALKAHCLAKLSKREEAIEINDSLLNFNSSTAISPQEILSPDFCNVMELTYNYMQHHKGVLELCAAVTNTVKSNIAVATPQHLQLLQEFMDKEFFTYLKMNDFASMNKSAMTMFKQFGHTKYLYWAISSNLVKHGQTLNINSPQISMLVQISEKLAHKATELDLTAKDEIKPYPSVQDWRLYLSALTTQSKFSEATTLLQTKVTTSDKSITKIHDETSILAANGSLVQMRPTERDELIASYMSKFGDFASSAALYSELISQSPEQWIYYENMWAASSAAYAPSTSEAVSACTKVCNDMVAKEKEDESTIHLRSPRLLLIKMASLASPPNPTLTSTLIKNYIDTFYKKQCCFSDLHPYLDQADKQQLVAHLLNLKSKDPLDLRKYIISSQLLAYFGEHSHNNVNELLKTWSSSLKELIPGEQDTQPGDELIQVAAERLFNEADTPAKLICLAGVLETAIKLSPYNYHFKLIGLQVYGALTAFERGCGLFNGLGVKNIQLDSLSYVLLDGLLKSGLFCEALKQSQDIQGMHLHSQRSLSDHLGKAYMYGNYSQVVDMLDFQKNKMAKSLQLFSSKSYTCTLACFQTDTLGELHGFSGKPEDDERAQMMTTIGEKWKHEDVDFATPNLVDQFSDNRDLKLHHNYESISTTLNSFNSKEFVFNDAARISIIHEAAVNALTGCAEYKIAKKKGKGKEEKRQKISVLEGLEKKMELLHPIGADSKDTVLMLAVSLVNSVLVFANCENDNSTLTLSLEAVTEKVNAVETSPAWTKHTSSSSSSWLAASCEVLPNLVIFVALQGGLARLIKKRRLATLSGWSALVERCERLVEGLRVLFREFENAETELELGIENDQYYGDLFVDGMKLASESVASSHSLSTKRSLEVLNQLYEKKSDI